MACLYHVRIRRAARGAHSAHLSSFVALLLGVHDEFIGRLQTPLIEDVLKPHRLVHGVRQLPVGKVFRRGEFKDVEPDFIW